MSKRPSLTAENATALDSMGLKVANAYQPESLFVKDGRKLSRVAIPADPWFVMLARRDTVLWADDAQIGSAQGADFNAAVAAALPTGLRAAMLALETACAALTESLHAC